MNKNWYNCCCHCDNFKNEYKWEKEKETHKCCFEEKEFPKCECFKEEEYPKCGSSQNKFQNKNYDYGFNNKSNYEGSCGCQSNNYGYNKYDQNKFGWY